MAQVEVEENDEGDFQVRTPYDDDWRERAKELKGRWNPEERVWVFRSEQHELEDLKKEVRLFFPGYR